MMLFGIPHGDEPCTSCMALMGPEHDQLRVEMVLPVPEGARAPMSRTQKVRGKPMYVCYDCAAAEALMSLMGLRGEGFTFAMARVAVGNDRQEMLRLPGTVLGTRVARPSMREDLDTLHDWHARTLGSEEAREIVRRDMELAKQ